MILFYIIENTDYVHANNIKNDVMMKLCYFFFGVIKAYLYIEVPIIYIYNKSK